MRKKLGDPDDQIAAKMGEKHVPEKLTALPPIDRIGRGPEGEPRDVMQTAARHDPAAAAADEAKFAKMVPEAVRKEWDEFAAAFADRYHLTDVERRRFDGTLDEAERAELAARKEFDDTSDRAKKEELAKKIGPGDLTLAAMAAYGRWVAGAEPRNSKMRYVSGDTPLTAPQRLEYIRHRQADLEAVEKRDAAGLGTGYGLETAKAKDLRALIALAKSTLVTDADAFLLDLKREAFGAVLNARFEQQAPTPGEVIGKDDARLLAALPASAPNPASFDALPAELKEAVEKLVTAFKGFYPVPEGSALDEAAARGRARFAHWYFDRDEFTGQPKPGFGRLAKAYRDKAKLAADLKPRAEAAAGYTKFLLTAAAKKADDDAKAARAAILTGLDTKYAEFKKGLIEVLPAEIVAGTRARYVEAFERLTEIAFDHYLDDPEVVLR
jgi:hypothetical protein